MSELLSTFVGDWDSWGHVQVWRVSWFPRDISELREHADDFQDWRANTSVDDPPVELRKRDGFWFCYPMDRAYESHAGTTVVTFRETTEAPDRDEVRIVELNPGDHSYKRSVKFIEERRE